MKKFASILVFLISFSISLPAQVITFCHSVNAEGQCIDHPKKFYIPVGKQAEIYATVHLLDEVGTTKVEYKIYRITNYLDEVYMTSLFQDVKPEMKTFYKRIAFSMELNYKIYLYTDSGKLLTSAPIFVEADYQY